MTDNRVPRVVVADDETHVRTLMRSLLRKMAYDVVGEASDGKKAVEVFRDKRPDILLLDLNMPFQNGIDTLCQIKKEFPEAMVIMLTSVADRESVEKAISMGAVNYIRKDTSVKDIGSLITETWQTFVEGLSHDNR